MGKKNTGLKIGVGLLVLAFGASVTYSAVPAVKEWTDGIVDKILVRPSEDVSSEEPSSEAPSEDLSEEPSEEPSVIPSLNYQILEEVTFSEFVDNAVATTGSGSGLNFNVYTYQSELAHIKIIVKTLSDLTTDDYINDNNGQISSSIKMEYIATTDIATQNLNVGIIVHSESGDYYGFTITKYIDIDTPSIASVLKPNSTHFVVTGFSLIQIL